MEHLELIRRETGFILSNETESWTLKRDIGFSPVQTLVSAVAGCGGYVYESLLDKSRLPVRVLAVSLDYQTNQETSNHYVTQIDLVYHLEAEPHLHERVTRLLEMIHKHCPVMASLNPEIIVTQRIAWKAAV